MVVLQVFWDGQDIRRFVLSGHAGFASAGQDIVCAAVSVLVYNAINSSEQFAGLALPVLDEDSLTCDVPVHHYGTRDVQLLLRSMVFGIRQVADQYSTHVVVLDENEPSPNPTKVS